MSTAPHATRVDLPLLYNGQRLDQAEFHERYEAMPPGVRAELINGVVSMPSPVGPDHGRAHFPPLAWLGYYADYTPGVEMLVNTSTILGPRSEPQPDGQLRILRESGGRTVTDRHFVHGVPELVVEVSHSTRYRDLGPKLEDYERAGVLEYVVRGIEPDEVVWHILKDARLEPIEPDSDGLFRSRVFPGLWLDPRALLEGNNIRGREVLDQGLAAPEHAAFVAELARRRHELSGKPRGASPS